jgi:lipoate-protein ligase A
VGQRIFAGEVREVWRRVPLHGAPMDEHLARVEATLGGVASAGRPVLAWYLGAPPALVLGVGQKAPVVDASACRAADVPVYKRPAGGTAVYFSEWNLGQDIVLPPGHPLAGHDIVEAYRWLGETWVVALRALGLPARVVSPAEAHAPRTRPATHEDALAGLACYGTLSPYEVVIEGRKVIGLDQVRRRAGYLFQAGVLRRWEVEQLAGLLHVGPEERAALVRVLRERAAGLDEFLGRDIAPEALIDLFEAALAERLGIRLATEPWTADETRVIQQLAASLPPSPRSWQGG